MKKVKFGYPTNHQYPWVLWISHHYQYPWAMSMYYVYPAIINIHEYEYRAMIDIHNLEYIAIINSDQFKNIPRLSIAVRICYLVVN
jgi:hypothetical protein